MPRVRNSGAIQRSGRRHPRLVLAARALLALAVGLALVPLELATHEAEAATPTLLLGKPRAGEYQPVRGDNFLAWQENRRANPGRFNVYARPLAGEGGRFKVNAGASSGALGDIDGDVLVYQEFRRGRSDLRLFDLAARRRLPLPAGVNTPQWEYWPSMSGQWLLFARLAPNGLRRLVLFDLAANSARVVDRIRGANAFIAPGQVNGDYAVWHKCRSNTACNVFLYDISERTKTVVPNPEGRNQHAASVMPDGTVFFARSRGACGAGVQLVRRPLDGPTTVLWRLPSGDDIATTRASTNDQGVATILYDHYACGQAADSDAWEIAEDFAPQLTVRLEGDGDGTVTSAPAGIDCEPDCTESYDAGTGVVLLAEASDGSTFTGWSGACTGTMSTCTLVMNGPRSVTATFSDRPLLSVSKSGTGGGTVTSSPGGIDCGSDCEQEYDPGTSVTLTATAGDDSTFDGWSGACSGMSSCVLTMNTSHAVTATFNEIPPDPSPSPDPSPDPSPSPTEGPTP
jgi:hypothetical protein